MRLSEEAERQRFATWLTDVLRAHVNGPLRVLPAPGAHRFYDHPRGLISLINLESVRDIERHKAKRRVVGAIATLVQELGGRTVAEGVEDALLAEWATSMPGLAGQAQRAAVGNAPKAWRFAGELEEIADSFAAHSLPDGFGKAAAAIYERLSQFKDTTGTTLDDVIDALLQSPS